MEWAPHPDKQEAIFLNVVMKCALDHGDCKTTDAAGMEKVLQAAAQAWQGYVAVSRRKALDGARQSMEFSSTLEELMQHARTLADVPQTRAERDTSLALLDQLKARFQQPQPQQQAPPGAYEQGYT